MKWLRNPEAILTVLCAVFLVAHFITGLQWLAILSVLCGGVFAVIESVESLLKREIDVHLLMILAAAGSIITGNIADAGMLLFLFSLSGTLEHMALAKTKNAIEALVKLRPEKAIKVTDSGDIEVDTASLSIGDTVRVLPYQQIPSDGDLLTELASIDESSMTGESIPVDRMQGDGLFAGTQNLDSMLLFRVSKAPGDNTLERIVTLVEEAQNDKASGIRISNWFGKRYTIIVIAAFLLSFVVRLAMHQPLNSAFYAALILLVALSPCALVISTPAATLSALAFAARKGILVRGGQFIEFAGKVDTLALDKTGTLTEGKPRLEEICAYVKCDEKILTTAGHHCQATGGCNECNEIVCWHSGDPIGEVTREAFILAAAAEAFSTHPIAQAIVNAAREHRIDIVEATQVQSVTGMGILAHVNGVPIKIGQPKFFDEAEDPMPEVFHEHVHDIQSRGMTSVLLRFKDEWVALGLKDRSRVEAKPMIDSMRSLGVTKIALLTGDNPTTANAISNELGITEVYAGVLPHDKAEITGEWIRQGKMLMMVGDGVNDAPALAQAHIGVAMGGLGSDIALRAADVVIIHDKLEKLPLLVKLGKLANRIIAANLWFAGGMIACLAVLSFVWPYVPVLSNLSARMPLPLAVIGHEGSTVIVILNSLRLLNGPAQKSP